MERLELYKGKSHVDSILSDMAYAICKHDLSNTSIFSILKGGLYTTFNICRHIFRSVDDINNLYTGYLGLSSYGDKITSELKIEVTYDFDLTEKLIKGRDILVIDDICDKGDTLDYARGLILAYEPKSFKTAVLVDKKHVREMNHYPVPDIVGTEYEGNNFLVGCGMGYGEKYRNLRELYELILE